MLNGTFAKNRHFENETQRNKKSFRVSVKQLSRHSCNTKTAQSFLMTPNWEDGFQYANMRKGSGFELTNHCYHVAFSVSGVSHL